MFFACKFLYSFIYMQMTTATVQSNKKRTIHIFGDSHANFNFSKLQSEYPVQNHYRNSITLHRVGRDSMKYIDFRKYNITSTDIIVYQFGEIDCRCHIHKQMGTGRRLSEIVENLVTPYLDSIQENLRQMKTASEPKGYSMSRFSMQFTQPLNLSSSASEDADPVVIVCCIPPPMNNHKTIVNDFGEFPFRGSNADRAMYTETMNAALQQGCFARGFLFFNYYANFIDASDPSCKMLDVAISDGICHIQKNGKLLEKFRGFISNL